MVGNLTRERPIRKIESQPSNENSLLLTLEEISQLVSHSHDPAQTLTNIVRLIQDLFKTDVCSVYLFEPDHEELVLGATIGLKPESVGRVRMHCNEGLTGLVAEKLAPVMVHDAFTHPRFKYFPEAGEDPYHSFLGVPLVEGGVLQGVLVVQTREARYFSPDEARMLVTTASQLAPLVSGANLLQRIDLVTHQENEPVLPEVQKPTFLQGVSLSSGLGKGEAYIITGFDAWQCPVPENPPKPAHEARRLVQAMEAARMELKSLSQHISTLVGQDHGAILQAQLMLMQDRTIEQDLASCLEAGLLAEAALIQVLKKYTVAFQKLKTPLFQERIFDVKDVFRRILWHLRPHPVVSGSAEQKVVLVAHEGSVMDLFSVDPERLAGVVIEHGGGQSHAAILARTLGIPMVGQITEAFHHIKPGQELVVDGTHGKIYLDPPFESYSSLNSTASVFILSAEELPRLTPPLIDGPRLEANINLLFEAKGVVKHQASGVGLFRSEFLFLARRTLPTEEEQVGIYRKLLQVLQGRPATIRIFDLRPDKLGHREYWKSAAEGPLDWRRVLDSTPLQKLFKDQVRAILRAATSGPARILVPLVTQTDQLDFVVQTIQETKNELRHESLEYRDNVPLGIMIEVAAAVDMVETWASLVDFFAIGTNDLVASALGLNREETLTVGLNDPLHPGVLRMIDRVIQHAHRADRPVSVCGEMAADPEGALALTALDVDSLSVPVNQLDAIRRILSGQSLDSLKELAPDLLQARTAKEARTLLRNLES